MGMIAVNLPLAEVMLEHAIMQGRLKNATPVDVGASTLLAAVTLLSSCMNDEQVRAVLEQAFERTAPVRRVTEARWKETGFDPYADEAPGKSS